MDDLISRQDAIDAIAKMMPQSFTPDGSHPADKEIFIAQEAFADCIKTIEILPTAQSEIIRCRDCRYGVDYYHDGNCYCAKPGYELLYFDGSWDFYCANAERRT